MTDQIKIWSRTYAHSNPVSYTDPSGYFTVAEQSTASAISGIIAGIYNQASAMALNLFQNLMTTRSGDVVIEVALEVLPLLFYEDVTLQDVGMAFISGLIGAALNVDKGTTDFNIVKRAITPEQAETIRNGQGILKPKPAHKTTPTQHVSGTKHSRNPWTSTTKSTETAEFFATNGGKNLSNPNPIIEIDLSKIDPNNILDVSTPEKAAAHLKTPFTRNVAAAHQEILIYGDIPPEAIITVLK